jgi:hypothetical protein
MDKGKISQRRKRQRMFSAKGDTAIQGERKDLRGNRRRDWKEF